MCDQVEVIELLEFLYIEKISHKKHGLKPKISIFYGFKPCKYPELRFLREPCRIIPE